MSNLFSAHFQLFWTFVLTTEHIEHSHRALTQQHHQHPTKMRQYCVVSRILLIFHSIEFAVAAPVPVQKNPQAVHIPGNAITMLGKRGDRMDTLLFVLFGDAEDHFVRPEDPAPRPASSLPSVALVDWRTDVNRPPSPIPGETPPSPDYAPPSPWSFTESGNDLTKGGASPGSPGQSQASSAMSSTDHELMRAHALPNPGPSTESDHETVGVPPPPGSASPIESDNEMDVPPSSPVSLTNPDSQWMGLDSSSGKRKRPD